MTGLHLADQLDDVGVAVRVAVERVADRVRAGELSPAEATAMCLSLTEWFQSNLDDWCGRFRVAEAVAS